ncbi:MAG: hypothetical protein VCA36_12080 [Opitutales bacterium]
MEKSQGFITREAGDEMDLRDVAGKVTTLKKSKIKSRATQKQPMMPEALTAGLTVGELASLLDYLQTLK